MIRYIVAVKSFLDINTSYLIFYLRSYLYNLLELTRPSLRNLTQGFAVQAISSLLVKPSTSTYSQGKRVHFPPRNMMSEFTFWALIYLLYLIVAEPQACPGLVNEPTRVLILELCRRSNDAANRYWNLVIWDFVPHPWNFLFRCWRSGMESLHSIKWSLVTNFAESAWVDLKTLASIVKEGISYLPDLVFVLFGIVVLESFISENLMIQDPKLRLLLRCG